MAQILKNNVSGVLGLALGASSTSMTLLDASNFPTPPGGDFYLLTLIGLNTNGQEATWEVVKVVAKADNTLTVVRAQEGTTAAAWPVATTVQLRLTAGSVTTPDVVAAHVGSSGASHAAASTSVAGFMSAADKTKLDGVATNANNYAHPTGDGNLHVPATGTTNAGKVLTAGSTAGSLSWATPLALGSSAGTAAGTAAAGTATTAARSDHVHPVQTSVSGNAGTATKLATARTIGMTGDVTWTSAAFDGSGSVTGAATLAASGATAGTYKSVTVDAKGRVTAGTNPTTLAGYGITDAAASSHSHPASSITQDANNRFVTDAEKTAWNGKESSGTAAAAMTAHTSAADPHGQYLPKAGGTMSGPINFAPAQTWPIFNQSTTGNAGTATKLAAAVKINGVDFDGSQPITVNAVDSTAREPGISAGTTAQYWRGDKSWRDFFTDVRAATLTGLSTATNAVISATDTVLGALGKLQKQVSDNLTTLTSHTGNTSNPHSVTKAQVGLGNVDNTSDDSKPISTAAQTALNAKQNTLVSGTNIKTLNGEPLLGAGNLVLQVAADQPSAVTYAYDASGRVETTTETLPTGTRTTTVTYNEAGQVKTVTVTLGTSTRTTQYAYDQYGVLTGTTSTES